MKLWDGYTPNTRIAFTRHSAKGGINPIHPSTNPATTIGDK